MRLFFGLVRRLLSSARSKYSNLDIDPELQLKNRYRKSCRSPYFKFQAILLFLFLFAFVSISLISTSCSNYMFYLRNQKNIQKFVVLSNEKILDTDYLAPFAKSFTNKRIDPFDPRLSLGATISTLKNFIKSAEMTDENAFTDDDLFSIDFHWDDWMDLGDVGALFNAYRTIVNDQDKKKNFAIISSPYFSDLTEVYVPGQSSKGNDTSNDIYAIDEEIGKLLSPYNPTEREESSRQALRGAINLYSVRLIPQKLLILTEEKFFEIPISKKKRYGKKGLYELYYQNDSKKYSKIRKALKNNTGEFPISFNIEDEIVDLISTYKNKFPNYTPESLKSKHDLSKKSLIDIPLSSFELDPQKELDQMLELEKSSPILDKVDQKWLDMLKYAVPNMHNQKEWFSYPHVNNDPHHLVDHIAYPFYKKPITDKERGYILNRLSRAWFEFCMAHDIATWIWAGSLIGWHFNGLNLPYDTDIDVILPVQHLAWLGKHYNQTLIVEDPRIGNGRFYFEVSPWFLGLGNRVNTIDARIIDIRTGIYIDISTQSTEFYDSEPPENLWDNSNYTKNSSTVIVCKSWNWMLFEDVSPIRRTLFEGYKAQVPYNHKRILDRKYGEISYTRKDSYAGYNYDKDTKLWVSGYICSDFPPTDTRFDSDGLLTLEGACGSKAYMNEYNDAKEALDLHSLEMEMIEKNEGNNTYEFIGNPINLLNKALKPDPWGINKDLIEKNGNANSYW